MADAYRRKSDVAGLLDLAGDATQMVVQIAVAIRLQCGIVDRRTVGQHDQMFPPFFAPA